MEAPFSMMPFSVFISQFARQAVQAGPCLTFDTPTISPEFCFNRYPSDLVTKPFSSLMGLQCICLIAEKHKLPISII
jgi:hypothetical protein